MKSDPPDLTCQVIQSLNTEIHCCTEWPGTSGQKQIKIHYCRENGYHPDGETLEVDWPRHPSRSFHCENCFTLDARRKTQEGPPQDHMATDTYSGERNQGDGEDLGRHQAYGKGPADVEGACCCPTCHLGVKGMSE